MVRSEKSERVKRGEQRLKEYEQKKKRDKELYAQAYMLPSDSIVIVPEEVYEKAYENGMSTSPSLYSIERRKNDTKVTFIQPIYWNWQWYSRPTKPHNSRYWDQKRYHIVSAR